MKKILLSIVFISSIAFGQKYQTKTGQINFTGSVAGFEKIQAESKQAFVLFDEATNNIASVLPVKSFEFAIKLMQEHFNENYAETDKYPKSKFVGKLIEENGKQYLKGRLTFHGVTNEIKPEAEVKKEGDTYTVKSNFILKPADYKIKIPWIVRSKVAKEIKVKLDFSLDKK